MAEERSDPRKKAKSDVPDYEEVFKQQGSGERAYRSLLEAVTRGNFGIAEAPDDLAEWLEKKSPKAREFLKDNFVTDHYRVSDDTRERHQRHLDKIAGNEEPDMYNTAGRIAGEMSMMGPSPHGKSKLVNTGLDAIISGVQGLLRKPDEGQTRTENAATDSIGSVAAEPVEYVTKKLIHGIDKNESAESLNEAGVYLTPGQASDNPFFTGVESVMKVFPGLSRGTKTAKGRGERAWTLQAIKDAAPDGVDIKSFGTKGYRELSKAFTDSYDRAWEGAGTVNIHTLAPMVKKIDEIMPDLLGPDARVMKKVRKELMTAVKSGNVELSALDRIIRREIKSANNQNNLPLMDDLYDLKNKLRDQLPDDQWNELIDIDERYPDFLAIQRATAAAADERGAFKPKQLLNASKQISSLDAIASGRGALQETALEGIETVGKKEPGAPMEWFRRIADISPTPLPLQLLGNLGTGDNIFQKHVFQPADLLRPSMTKVGAGYVDDEGGEDSAPKSFIKQLLGD